MFQRKYVSHKFISKECYRLAGNYHGHVSSDTEILFQNTSMGDGDRCRTESDAADKSGCDENMDCLCASLSRLDDNVRGMIGRNCGNVCNT